MPNDAPVKKKGLPTIAWVAIGCAGLVVVALIAIFGLGLFAVHKGKEIVAEATGSETFEDFVEDLQDNPLKKTAEAMIGLDPQLEIVSTDDEAGTITFRNLETGEEATLDFHDIAEGRLSVTTDEGEFALDADEGEGGGITLTGPEGQTRLGADADLREVPAWVPIYPQASSTQSLYHTVAPNGVSGVVVVRTTDGAQQVIDHYREELEKNGWSVGSQSMTTSGDSAFGSITGEFGGRSLTISVAEQGGECQVSINYNGKV